MSSFNVFSMAVLLALVIVKGADLIADALVHPQIILAKNSYVVEGVGQKSSGPEKSSGPVLEAVEPLLASANIENGIKVAKKCLQCHTLDKGGKAKTGPNLWNAVERNLGAVDGYAYSKAMKEHGGKWTFAKLNEYLYKPRTSVPGTKMSFAGLKKVQDRADLIAYLNSLSDAPKALPVVGPAAAPAPSPEAAPAA